jgi:F-type H+-transporting ATPase subunit a
MELHIPTLAPETIFHIGKLPVTNTIVNVWLAIAVFILVGLSIRKKVNLKPGKMQNFMEFFLEKLLTYFDQITGDRKKTLSFLPLVGSVFFFILLSNWLGLLPGTGSIHIGEAPLLRPANSDLNMTLAMAVSVVVISHIVGLVTVGVFTHLNKFVQIGSFVKSLRKGPIAIFTAIINLAVGLIEIVSEFAKVLSLSLRLFGNIFAGEVLITVIASIMAVFLPAPFMLLELLVGLVQASVFTMLTLVYLTVMSSEPHGEHH